MLYCWPHHFASCFLQLSYNSRKYVISVSWSSLRHLLLVTLSHWYWGGRRIQSNNKNNKRKYECMNRVLYGWMNWWMDWWWMCGWRTNEEIYQGWLEGEGWKEYVVLVLVVKAERSRRCEKIRRGKATPWRMWRGQGWDWRKSEWETERW